MGRCRPLWAAPLPRQGFLSCVKEEKASKQANRLACAYFSLLLVDVMLPAPATATSPHEGPWPGIVSRTNLFLPKSLFVMIFYHTDRNETRIHLSSLSLASFFFLPLIIWIQVNNLNQVKGSHLTFFASTWKIIYLWNSDSNSIKRPSDVVVLFCFLTSQIHILCCN